MTSVALSDWLVDTTKITRALNCKHNVMNGEGGEGKRKRRKKREKGKS